MTEEKTEEQIKQEAYIKSFLSRVEKDPELLDKHKHEAHLGKKFLDARGKSERISADITRLQEQIKQAEARINSLVLQEKQEEGRARGILESIVALKFFEEPEEKIEAAQVSKKNGKQEKPGSKPQPSREATA